VSRDSGAHTSDTASASPTPLAMLFSTLIEPADSGQTSLTALKGAKGIFLRYQTRSARILSPSRTP
jgi:hypothetical protein